MIFETVAHFEPLVAAELAPRCRTGVAWICWARCALSVGVVGLEMSRVSSPCVAIDEQMEGDRIDDDRTEPHAHESRPFLGLYHQENIWYSMDADGADAGRARSDQR